MTTSLLACLQCVDGNLWQHPDPQGPVLVCDYCTAEYDAHTLHYID